MTKKEFIEERMSGQFSGATSAVGCGHPALDGAMTSRESEIRVRFSDLESRLNRLTDLQHEVHNRLEPVLSPPPPPSTTPCGDGAKEPVPPVSPFSEHLMRLMRHAEQAIQIAEETLARLEI